MTDPDFDIECWKWQLNVLKVMLSVMQDELSPMLINFEFATHWSLLIILEQCKEILKELTFNGVGT